MQPLFMTRQPLFPRPYPLLMASRAILAPASSARAASHCAAALRALVACALAWACALVYRFHTASEQGSLPRQTRFGQGEEEVWLGRGECGQVNYEQTLR